MKNLLFLFVTTAFVGLNSPTFAMFNGDEEDEGAAAAARGGPAEEPLGRKRLQGIRQPKAQDGGEVPDRGAGAAAVEVPLEEICTKLEGLLHVQQPDRGAGAAAVGVPLEEMFKKLMPNEDEDEDEDEDERPSKRSRIERGGDKSPPLKKLPDPLERYLRSERNISDEEAMRLLQKEVDSPNGSPKAYGALSYLRISNEEESRRLLERGVQAGDHDAELEKARRLLLGIGGYEKNLDAAFKILDKLSLLGDSYHKYHTILFNLGLFYSLNSIEKAIDYYAQAAKGGEWNAMIELDRLGQFYLDKGQGEKALEIFEKANSLKGLFNRANILLNGLGGVPQNEKEGLKLLLQGVPIEYLKVPNQWDVRDTLFQVASQRLKAPETRKLQERILSLLAKTGHPEAKAKEEDIKNPHPLPPAE